MPKPTIIRFYKPYGVLTKFTDADNRPTLGDYIEIPKVYAAGRLDKDSEGLLILTDHNRLKTRLTEPRFEHPRTYLVQVEGVPDEAALQTLANGVVIRGERTKKAQVRLLDIAPQLPPRDPPVRFRKTVPTAFLELRLTEGKNRQVRRMTAAVGYPTLRLIRTAIGPINLTGLEPGAFQHLSQDEAKALFSSVGL